MEMPARESMEFDVVIVGAGPAGLAAAIRLKQIATERNQDISVVVIEKGSEVGAHMLSGVIIDPVGIDHLLPGWREDTDRPFHTTVTKDNLHYLTASSAFPLFHTFMPKRMDNTGFFVGSLGSLAKYLATKAEALGVEIYPGFAAVEVLCDADKRVRGVATGDMGIDHNGTPRADFTRGMELHAKYTLFAEGARGSLSRQMIAQYNLAAECEPPKFGLGIKELWEVAPEKHQPGLVEHSIGWPLKNDSGGGTFIYHYGNNLVTVGLVAHLNYTNPTMSPFEEMQRFKTHPKVRGVFEGGKRIGYGARVIAEGGWQSVPRLSFPGGCLIGDAAGFINVPRIKGSHNAMNSGILCAEHVAEALAANRANDEVSSYEDAWRSSDIGADLYPVRNAKPLLSKFGTILGLMLGGIDMWVIQLFGFSPFGTLKHGKPDNETLKPLSEVTPIIYPKPDGVLTFDRLSSVFLSNTNHEENQPCHLKLTDPTLPIAENLPKYGEPAQFYCPAGVYEVVYDEPETKHKPRFVINFQNCVHCKTCDIKDPRLNIIWTPPEGGNGPNYVDM